MAPSCGAQTNPTEMDAFEIGEGRRTRATTALSPYLKFGCLSPRLFHERLADVYKRVPAHSKPPTSLHGQLYWREFYYTCALGTPNYERMVGNPICRQVPEDGDPNPPAAHPTHTRGTPTTSQDLPRPARRCRGTTTQSSSARGRRGARATRG